MGIIGTALDVAKFIPGVGTVACAISAVKNLAQRKYLAAGLDLIGAIPLAGQLARGAIHLGPRAAQLAGKLPGLTVSHKAWVTSEHSSRLGKTIRDAAKTVDSSILQQVRKVVPHAKPAHIHRVADWARYASGVLPSVAQPSR